MKVVVTTRAVLKLREHALTPGVVEAASSYLGAASEAKELGTEAA